MMLKTRLKYCTVAKPIFFGGAGHLDNRFLQESVSRFQLTFLW